MVKVAKPPNPMTELADRLEAVRGELLTIQRLVEKIEKQETPQPTRKYEA
jgi:hypothetical protein